MEVDLFPITLTGDGAQLVQSCTYSYAYMYSDMDKCIRAWQHAQWVIINDCDLVGVTTLARRHAP